MKIFNRPAFGNAVRAYRTKNNISRAELAKQSEVTKDTIEKIENASYVSDRHALVAHSCDLDLRRFIFEDGQLAFTFKRR